MKSDLRFTLCLVAGAALAFTSSARAQELIPISEEFAVSPMSSDRNSGPSVAGDSTGEFVVVWPDYDEVGRISARRFDADGNPLGELLQLNEDTSGIDGISHVGKNRLTGDFVAVWNRNIDNNLSLWGRRFEKEGQPMAGEFEINAGRGYFAGVEVFDSGDFVVVWHEGEDDGFDADIKARRYASDGSSLGGEFTVNTHTPDSQVLPDIASDGSGDFIIVWESELQDGWRDGVYGQRFSSLGLPEGDEFLINAITTGDQFRASLDTNAAGDFVVGWQDSYPGDYAFKSKARQLTSTGEPKGGNLSMDDPVFVNQVRPKLTVEASGHFVMVWSGDGSDPDVDDFRVFARRFDPEGTPMGQNQQISNINDDWQLDADIAVSQGTFMVVWTDYTVPAQKVRGRFYKSSTLFGDGFETGDFEAWSESSGGL